MTVIINDWFEWSNNRNFTHQLLHFKMLHISLYNLYSLYQILKNIVLQAISLYIIVFFLQILIRKIIFDQSALVYGLWGLRFFDRTDIGEVETGQGDLFRVDPLLQIRIVIRLPLRVIPASFVYLVYDL